MESTASEGPRKGRKSAAAGATRRRPEGDAERTAAEAAPDTSDGRALSVTRPASFSVEGDWKVLAAGLDSLDLGLCVCWGLRWPSQVEELDRLKELAAGTEGITTWDNRCLMLPGGKPPMFRWHLQYPGFHLFLGKSERPSGDTPNVYVSINAETLWRLGPLEAVALVIEEIRRLAGRVESVKVSRVDLAVDLLIPGGLPLSYLLERRVPANVEHEHFMTADRLETFYHGSKKSPIRCRIYDKGLEVAEKGTKFWFLEVWGIESLADVFRVEFQLRRKFLKEARINTVEDLLAKQAEVWEYLTGQRFSLREPDNGNATRRTVTPWWEVIQGAFGTGAGKLVRSRPDDIPAETAWTIKHVGGLLPGYAARRGEPDSTKAMAMLGADVLRQTVAVKFAEAYARKRIALGRPVETDRSPSPSADAA